MMIMMMVMMMTGRILSVEVDGESDGFRDTAP